MTALSQTVRVSPDGDATSRSRVLDAAERVFAERGFAGATTREIALAAGVQKRMLFYYFSSKDDLYRAVLERIITELVGIHEQFHGDPGPIGLAEVTDGLTAFAAGKLDAVRILLREIMDAGPHLRALADEHLRALFTRGAAEVARNMADGTFRPGDPMQVLLHVGGLTFFYFLNVPLLRLVWDRDPLAPETLAERAAAVRDLLMHGLAGASSREGAQ
jgi:TetR/AcrR family transcriptional regulator